MPLATPVLTDISSKAQIFFAESPIHFNFTPSLNRPLEIEVYIWRGSQLSVPSVPQVIFKNLTKISPSDSYIAIELHNEIKAFITSSNLNKNNPQWAYNATEQATTSGEGVYFHIIGKFLNNLPFQLGTFFATTGYRYSFEQKGGMYTTYDDVETFRKYARSINYDRSTINLTTTVADSTTENMISKQVIDPAERLIQTGVPCLVAYINRNGLWDTFTPFGKFVESIDTRRDEFASSFRNPLNVNSQIQHLKQSGAPKGFRKFQINTGLLDERNNYQIREILQSSKIYLVIFGNDVFQDEQVGITVDSTEVSVDNTSITVDSDVVGAENIGFYSKFTQIPVKNTSTNFQKKTRLNDKSSISYTLEFEETNNFINDIL